MRVVSRPILHLERAAWLVAILALAVWAIATVLGMFGTRRDLQRFASAKAAAASAVPLSPGSALADQHLCSAARIRAWQETQGQASPPPLAMLHIRRLGIAVPVLEGTDEWTLNRAAGHIDGTVRPGADGNVGIAGHRDGFFRALKDVQSGDVVELETTIGVDHYRVERSWIVQPEDVSVLAPTDAAAVTLVTCYPFYFVGSAPQRFIVRAVRTRSDSPHHDVH